MRTRNAQLPCVQARRRLAHRDSERHERLPAVVDDPSNAAKLQDRVLMYGGLYYQHGRGCVRRADTPMAAHRLRAMDDAVSGREGLRAPAWGVVGKIRECSNSNLVSRRTRGSPWRVVGYGDAQRRRFPLIQKPRRGCGSTRLTRAGGSRS